MSNASDESCNAVKRCGRGTLFRILVGLLFVLLSLHFVLVYTAPGYLLPHLVPRPTASGRPFIPGIPDGGIFRARDRIFERDGRTWLWGGPSGTDHFDVTIFRLKAAALNYGFGREHFAALVEPAYVSVEEADRFVRESEDVLLVRIGDEARVYPIGLLQRHEAVNDVVGDRSILVVWCMLARLGAVYDRNLEGHALTFAVSGYTYGEVGVWDGRQAFVLWDRDTESLWWPPIGKAVSGPMLDTPMRVLEEELWAQTTWKKVVEAHPDALVLAPDQTMKPPATWPRWSPPDRGRAQEAAPAESVAPPWGGNGGL